ncbi:MAG: carboxypeptidase regulatory-like domain-containing protein [bacterium]|nr:carboxypeptidase regulatory-like domain-containing protein [bacterium]
MKKKITALFTVILSVTLCCFNLNAEGPPQDPNDVCRIHGQVVDPDGSPLPGVTVMLESRVLHDKLFTITNGQGKYRFIGLPTGTYQLTFSLEGFSTHVQKGLVLKFKQQLKIDAGMTNNPIESTIIGGSGIPLVDPRPTVPVKNATPAPAGKKTGVSNSINQTGGVILGKVAGPGGTPLGGIRVILKSPSLKEYKNTVTDHRAMYRFQGLNAGTYQLTFEFKGPGLNTLIRKGVVLKLNQQIKLDATMTFALITEARIPHYSPPPIEPQSVVPAKNATPAPAGKKTGVSNSINQTGGVLLGKVVDPAGTPLPGVMVILKSPSLKEYKNTVTDHRGMYRFQGLKAGTYQLTFELAGLKILVRIGVEIKLNYQVTLETLMMPRPIKPSIITPCGSPVIERRSTVPAAKTTSHPTAKKKIARPKKKK